MASRSVRLARRVIYVLLVIAGIYGSVIGFNRYVSAKISEAMASAPPRTVSVSVSTATSQTWPDQLHAVGSMVAMQGAMLTAQSSGIVTSLSFRSGETVQKDQLLAQLNDNVAKTKLASDQAKLVKAKQDLIQQRRLFKTGMTSESDLQAAEAAFNEQTATVAGDKAALDNLQVRAPFDGHLGLRKVDLGQYVSPGTTMVEIQQWNPLRLQFDIPQQDLSLIHVGEAVDFQVLGDADAGTFPGKITAMGAAVSNDTRNIKIEATVENPDAKLKPGMFGNVTVRLNGSSSVTAVPSTAIAYNTYGEYVYVIESHDSAQVATQRLVKTGESRGDMVAIEDGVKPGEQVVIAGQVNLYPNARVKTVPLPKDLNSSANPATNATDGG